MLGKVLAFLTLNVSITSASYNVYNYDLSTPIFTPDGLLKQVEYASEASSHSHPMIIVPFLIGNQSVIIMATRNKSRRAQSRILQMPISQKSCGQSSLLVGINGVLSDCVSLLQVSRAEIQSINCHGSPNICTAMISFRQPLPSTQCAKRVAMSIADKCQQHNFGGGIRCFGAEIVVCDCDQAVVFVTQPSGSITEYRSSITGGELVVGGEKRKREQLYKLLQNKKSSLDMKQEAKNVDGLIRTMIKMIIGSMMELYDNDDDKSRGESLIEEFDLVIAHSSNGIVRIHGDRLMEVCNS